MTLIAVQAVACWKTASTRAGWGNSTLGGLHSGHNESSQNCAELQHVHLCGKNSLLSKNNVSYQVGGGIK